MFLTYPLAHPAASQSPAKSTHVAQLVKDPQLRHARLSSWKVKPVAHWVQLALPVVGVSVHNAQLVMVVAVVQATHDVLSADKENPSAHVEH